MGAEMALGACTAFGRRIVAQSILCTAVGATCNTCKTSLLEKKDKRFPVKAEYQNTFFHPLKRWNNLAFPLNPCLVSVFRVLFPASLQAFFP